MLRAAVSEADGDFTVISEAIKRIAARAAADVYSTLFTASPAQGDNSLMQKDTSCALQEDQRRVLMQWRVQRPSWHKSHAQCTSAKQAAGKKKKTRAGTRPWLEITEFGVYLRTD